MAQTWDELYSHHCGLCRGYVFLLIEALEGGGLTWVIYLCRSLGGVSPVSGNNKHVIAGAVVGHVVALEYLSKRWRVVG